MTLSSFLASLSPPSRPATGAASSSGDGTNDPKSPATTTTTTDGEVRTGDADKPQQQQEEDYYQWPNLFQEADDMLQVSLLMYIFTEVRELARRDKLLENKEDEAKILTLPLTAATAIATIERNERVLEKSLDGGDMKICREALRAIHERCVVAATGPSLPSSACASSSEGIEHPYQYELATLVAYGDTNAAEQLVYAVGYDHSYKRITVAFRGSVTPKDFMTDACIAMKPIMPDQPRKITTTAITTTTGNGAVDEDRNNGDGDRDTKGKAATTKVATPELMVHSGFHEYLLEIPSGAEPNDQNELMNKMDEIMTQHVLHLFEQHPTYKLYCTGHSLGAALATLFAYQVVANPIYSSSVPLPVTCVSCASPKVGNEGFRIAFQRFEEQGKLRHLRITNDMDPVTLGPPASSKVMWATLSPAALFIMSQTSETVQNELYKHSGIRLRLFDHDGSDTDEDKEATDSTRLKWMKGTKKKEEKKFTLKYSSGSWREDCMFKIPMAAASVKHHFGYEYSTRLLNAKAELEQLSLNDLYQTIATDSPEDFTRNIL